jgi:hypothetical protein
LAAVEVEDRSIHWLLGVPISDGERGYLEANGFDAFERLLADHDTPYFDLARPTIVEA